MGLSSPTPYVVEWKMVEPRMFARAQSPTSTPGVPPSLASHEFTWASDCAPTRAAQSSVLFTAEVDLDASFKSSSAMLTTPSRSLVCVPPRTIS